MALVHTHIKPLAYVNHIQVKVTDIHCPDFGRHSLRACDLTVLDKSGEQTVTEVPEELARVVKINEQYILKYNSSFMGRSILGYQEM